MQGRSARGREASTSVHGTVFTLDAAYGYRDFKLLGKGSYGVVVSSTCERLQKRVAIKKITPVAKHIYDAKHVLREIRIMRYFGQHENIISLNDLYYRESQDELYIAMELMDSDLHHVIQSKQALSEAHIKHFMHQLCCGVKYLHDHRVIHRDLKPGNVLVSKDCRLRITDFGLARERPVGDDEDDPDVDIDEPMTVHVVTRWYRAPELMLLPDGLYTYAVDIWSVGCILGEMLSRRPLFPGKTFIHQLALIFDVLGAPRREDVQHITHPEAKQFLAQQAHKTRQPWRDLFPAASSESLDLLAHFMLFDPCKRASMDDALTMDFLYNAGLPESRVFPPVSDKCEFKFEDPGVSRYQLKQLIVEEVASFRRERAPVPAPAKPALTRQASQRGSPDKADGRRADEKERKGEERKDGERGEERDDDAKDAAAARVPRYLQSTASHITRLQRPGAAVPPAARRLGAPLPSTGPERGRIDPVRAEASALPVLPEELPRSPSRLAPVPPPLPPEQAETVRGAPLDRMVDLQALLQRIQREDRYDALFPASPRRAALVEEPEDDLAALLQPRTPPRRQENYMMQVEGLPSPGKKSLLATYTSPQRSAKPSAAGTESDGDKTPDVRRSAAVRSFAFDDGAASPSPAHPAPRVYHKMEAAPSNPFVIEKHSYQHIAVDEQYESDEARPRNNSSTGTARSSIPEESDHEERVAKAGAASASSAGGRALHTMPVHAVRPAAAAALGPRVTTAPVGPHPVAGSSEEERPKRSAEKNKEKKPTRAVSPKFSVMSWQRRQAAEKGAKDQEPAPTAIKRRAASSGRMRL